MELVIDHAELIRNIELKTRSYAHERKTKIHKAFFWDYTSVLFLRNRGEAPNLVSSKVGILVFVKNNNGNLKLH